MYIIIYVIIMYPLMANTFPIFPASFADIVAAGLVAPPVLVPVQVPVPIPVPIHLALPMSSLALAPTSAAVPAYRPPSVRSKCTGCEYCHPGTAVCAAGILVIDNGDLILVQDKHSRKYGEPGGHYEQKDRCPEIAACRETFESSNSAWRTGGSMGRTASIINGIYQIGRAHV